MVLETHMKLFVTELDFLEKFYLSPKWGKWAKSRGFGIYWKVWSFIFSQFSIYYVKYVLFAMNKSHIWEKSSSWDMGQNALSQLDFRILKLNYIS